MASTFQDMKDSVERGGWEVIWSPSYGFGDVAAIAVCSYYGCLRAYLDYKLDELKEKVGQQLLEQAIRNKGKIFTGPDDLRVQAGDAYWSVYHKVWNPFANRNERLTTERYARIYVRYRGAQVATPQQDVLPGGALAEGQWGSIRSGHRLITMTDGRVLDWVPESGDWRLWSYDPENPEDVLPGLVASGNWGSIRTGHSLIPMIDGRVLDWEPSDGKWRLWNYDYSSQADILPGDPVAMGQWASIRGGHRLVPMSDGRVLDWVPGDGSWRLWNYNSTNTGDVLPGGAHAAGQWGALQSGHQLIPMEDGRVLDWTPQDGKFRLWAYNPGNTADILPGAPTATGQWESIRSGHVLIPMIDGPVLDWEPGNGRWRLWRYSADG